MVGPPTHVWWALLLTSGGPSCSPPVGKLHLSLLLLLLPPSGLCVGLQATHGPFKLTPFSAVKATPTRWDLLELLLAELTRSAAGHPNLLCVVPPLAGALAHGLLKAELGACGSGPLRYWSPYEVLASNLSGVQSLPRPPLWFEDGTLAPPRLPTEAELAALLRWWLQHRVVKGERCLAARGAGAKAVLPSGTKRKAKRPKRLVAEDSEDSEDSD